MTKQKILLILSAVFAAIILLMFLVTATFNFWFFINLVIWAGIIYWQYKPNPAKPVSGKRKLAVVVIAAIFSILTLVSIGGETDKKVNINTPAVKIEYKTIMDPIALVDLSLDLENSLKLEDVRISEVEGGIIEIHTKTPENVSPDAIMAATSYIFGYVDPKISNQIKTLRLIFTVNGLDASLIEVSRTNVKDWITKRISDEVFVSSMKKVSLVK